MAYTITDLYEAKRSCGYRKVGDLYLVAGPASRSCGKLPIALPDLCHCCGGGIQFHRGFQWVDNTLIRNAVCATPACSTINPGGGCFPFGHVKRFCLMWVGKEHYPSSTSFENEVATMGISKKIAQVPKAFTLGVDWVLLAHLHCVFKDQGDLSMKPGIFTAFCPERIEYVVMPTDSPQTLQAYADKGISLIRIHRKVNGQQLEMGPQGNPISDEATRFLAILTKHRGHRMRVARAENVTRQTVSKRLMGFYGLYPDVFDSFVRRRQPLVSKQNARIG